MFKSAFPYQRKASQPQVPEQAHDPREGHPLLSHLGKQAVDSFRSFEEALVTEDQEYDVIALPEQRRWQPVPSEHR